MLFHCKNFSSNLPVCVSYPQVRLRNQITQMHGLLGTMVGTSNAGEELNASGLSLGTSVGGPLSATQSHRSSGTAPAPLHAKAPVAGPAPSLYAGVVLVPNDHPTRSAERIRGTSDDPPRHGAHPHHDGAGAQQMSGEQSSAASGDPRRANPHHQQRAIHPSDPRPHGAQDRGDPLHQDRVELIRSNARIRRSRSAGAVLGSHSSARGTAVGAAHGRANRAGGSSRGAGAGGQSRTPPEPTVDQHQRSFSGRKAGTSILGGSSGGGGGRGGRSHSIHM